MAYVLFDSWAGRTKARVTILKVGPKRSKVRFDEKAFWRPAGHVQYVPNHAIEEEPDRCDNCDGNVCDGNNCAAAWPNER